MLRRTLAAQVKQQAAQGADLHQKIADTRDMVISTEKTYENSEKENTRKEPLQSQHYGLISTRNFHAFVSDLFDVAKALHRLSLRLLPRNILAAVFFRQQIKMKLQLFFHFTRNTLAVQTSKRSDIEVHGLPFATFPKQSPKFGRLLARRAPS